MLDIVKKVAPSIPVDADRLDRLMDEAGIDVLLATSKHNVQYLLGGHRAFFFESMDAMGLSRYLPVLVYPKGARQKAAYFGHRMEGFQKENDPFWVSESQTNSSGTVDAMQKAIDYARKLGAKPRRIGAELGFLPVDAGTALRNAFLDSEIVDALFVLERLRAVKSPEELRKLRIASERVIESMLAVIANHGPGASKRELTEALRREETDRGLVFDYCLITAGSSLNRAPSEQKWNRNDILSLDSGGNYHGYIGDVCPTTPTTRAARWKREWWFRSRPRCNTRSAGSSSSKTRSPSPTPASKSTARVVAAGIAAAPRSGEPRHNPPSGSDRSGCANGYAPPENRAKRSCVHIEPQAGVIAGP